MKSATPIAVFITGAILAAMGTLAAATPGGGTRAAAVLASGRQTVSTPAAKMRKTLADLGEMLREVRRWSSRATSSGASVSAGKLKAARIAIPRLARACDFLSRARPSELSLPRIVFAGARLAPVAGGVHRLSLDLLWLQRSPEVDGVVVFYKGKPRWQFQFCKLFREYVADLEQQQYDCAGPVQLASSIAKGYSRPNPPHWRTLPVRHPRTWATRFAEPLRQSWAAAPPEAGLWRFLDHRLAGAGYIEIALTRRGKAVGKRMRIPIIPWHQRGTGEKPHPAESAGAARHRMVAIPVPQKALAWQKLQILAYDHVWFRTPIHVRNWRRKMAIDYIELSAIPRLLPQSEADLRAELAFSDKPGLRTAFLRHLAKALKKGNAAPRRGKMVLGLGKNAGRIAALWRAVHFLRRAPQGALRLPTLVGASGVAGWPPGGASLSITFLCSRQIPSGALSLVIFRHGKRYLKLTPPWGASRSKSATPSYFVRAPGRHLTPLDAAMAALTLRAGPDYRGLSVERIRSALTRAAEHRYPAYLRRFFERAPVGHRFVDFLRARVGKSIRVGLVYRGKLMERTVRAAIIHGQ